MKSAMVRILLAEDHTIIRKGMRQILTEALPQALIEEIEEGEEWMERLTDRPWDVIISDQRGIASRMGEGLRYPDRQVLLLNLYTHEHQGYRALRIGNSGVLGRDAAADELIWAVRQILSGKKFHAIPSKNN
jgi:DNA-binding NarL/FixJ family response regulator